MKIRLIRIICAPILLCCMNVAGQYPAKHVDPFIGTERSDAPTIWGQFGGTYPGAVAPWGMVQLSPETRTSGEKGYFQRDSSICYFTCVNHSSGYPEGSHGSVQVTFGNDWKNDADRRAKEKEYARPGYYAVVFDDGDKVEMTATIRTGMFRYLPVGNQAVVKIADAGKIRLQDNRIILVERSNGLFIFNQPWTKSTIREQTVILEFDRLPESGLLVKTAFSTVDIDGSRKNLDAENPGWDFDMIKEETYKTWTDELSVVQVKSNNATDLAKFYTALYHSFLIPYIVSDIDGRYRGSDRQVHQTTGTHEYGKFSTWDSFRSLHPLLCLLKPQRQKDMLLSMLNIYDQRGYLPFAPMTGYHSIPIFADSYVKGITAFDTGKAYQASKKLLAGNQIPRSNTYRYIRDGFLNDSIEESVSVTLDYAYNDWTLSVLSDVTGHADDARKFRQRSFNYRNLFDAATGFILPRNASGFVHNPGEMGYKEADKWTASWFVPHNIQDLINLSGGDEYFVNRLQEAMQAHVIFDNEPVLHYPYLFSYAGRPDLTCHWVDHIRENCYTATPGGIPGNDDLGSMSSWFVFSAMGFFPVCPGRPEYVLATPLFSEIVIQQDHGKEMTINAELNAIHSLFSEIKLNGKIYDKSYITHQQIMDGGNLFFYKSSSIPSKELGAGYQRPASLTTARPEFQVKAAQLSSRKVFPHQQTYMRFTVTNTGETGVFPATIKDGEQALAVKKVFVEQGASITDSVAFRVYREGKHLLHMAQIQLPITVTLPKGKQQTLACNQLTTNVVVKKGEPVKVEMTLQNISGKNISQTVTLYNNGQSVSDITCQLSPGEITHISRNITADRTGFHILKILYKTLKVKAYDHPVESCVLDVDFDRPDKNTVWDASGFENHGTIVGQVDWVDNEAGKALQVNTNSLVAFPLSESLNIAGPTITLSAWVYPINDNRGYIDFFTKGDYIVFQTDGGQLSFFAGGWGRGTCSVTLPGNWIRNWHHIAGVCTGKELKLYLNGKLQQSIPVEGDIESTEIPWNLGRNAEMPYSRRFEGMFDNVKIFKDALTDQDIENLYNQKSKN